MSSTLQNRGIQAHVVREASRIVVVTNQSGLDGNDDKSLRLLPAVDSLINVTHRFKLASIQSRKQRTIVRVGDVEIGGETAVVIAGPCSVESREQLLAAARGVRDGGATMLRGGAYKPRTSPYEFQGLGVKGLKLLAEAREATGLPIVTEVMSTDDVELVCEYADVLQVGARNMQNFALLRRLAKVDKPVLLKRNPAATVEEWLLAAEYLLAGGNSNVILCERGIKGSGTETRNTFDISAVALARQLTHLARAGRSFACGRQARSGSGPVARRLGRRGRWALCWKCIRNPEAALSDGAQSLNIAEFAKLNARAGRAGAQSGPMSARSAPRGGPRNGRLAADGMDATQRREIMHANQ